jgi:hypothetical protein
VNSSIAPGRGVGVDAEEREQPLAEPLTLGARRDHELELLVRRRGIIRLKDPGVRLQHLAQRPESDPLPVGEASSLSPRDELRDGIDVPRQLGDDPALPDPRLAYDDDELRRARCEDLAERSFQDRQFDLTADVRRVVGPGDVRPLSGLRRFRHETADRLSLPLQVRRSELVVAEHCGRRSIGRFADRDAHLGSDRL